MKRQKNTCLCCIGNVLLHTSHSNEWPSMYMDWQGNQSEWRSMSALARAERGLEQETSLIKHMEKGCCDEHYLYYNSLSAKLVSAALFEGSLSSFDPSKLLTTLEK